MFRIFVPGFGNIFVQATNEQEAITGALKYLEQNGISNSLQPGTTDNLQAIQFNSASLPQGSLVVGSNGAPSAGGSGGGGGATPPPTATTPENPTSVAPPTAPPGSGVTGASPQGGTFDEATLEGLFPRSAFNEFARTRGINPEGIGGQLIGSQFGPALNAFAAANTLGLFPTNQEQPFQQFLESGPLGGRFRDLARQAFNVARSEGGLAQPTFFDDSGNFIFSNEAQNQLNLARQAAGAGRSPLTFQLGPSQSQLIQRLQDQIFQSGGRFNQDFLDFLGQQFRIPQMP